eukprot:2248083-Rhodomonas_salina.5
MHCVALLLLVLLVAPYPREFQGAVTDGGAGVTERAFLDGVRYDVARSLRQAKIKHKKPPFQHNLYQKTSHDVYDAEGHGGDDTAEASSSTR